METLNPKESLAIIQKIIGERKQKYEENGFFFIFWGILIIVASLGHFYMLEMNILYGMSYYIWLILMPLGFIFTFVWKMREGIKRKKSKKYDDWYEFLWLIVGFLPFFSIYLVYNQHLTFAIYLPFTIACLSTALRLKMKLWIVNSLISIVLCYLSAYTLHYQLVFMAVIAFLIFLVPGIQLFMDFKRRGGSR